MSLSSLDWHWNPADVVHEHKLLNTNTTPSAGLLLCCSVLTCMTGCYMSVLPLLYLEKTLTLQAEHLAVLSVNHSQPAALDLTLNREESVMLSHEKNF